MTRTVRLQLDLLPLYRQLDPAAVCAVCGESSLCEFHPHDAPEQHTHYVCPACAAKGFTATPSDIGQAAGLGIGRLYDAAKALLIELAEVIEGVTTPEEPTFQTRAATVQAARTLHEPRPGPDPFGPRPFLTTEHGDALVSLALDIRTQLAGLLALGDDSTP